MLKKDIEREAHSAAIRTGKKVSNGRGMEARMNEWMNEGKMDAKHPPGKPANGANGKLTDDGGNGRMY
jgi:hypothetical protein